MTDTEAMWSERVSAWRASGKSSPDFCKGKPFTAGGLRYWAHRLKGAKRDVEPLKPAVRLARVLRTPAPSIREVRAGSGPRPAPAAALTADSGLVLELSGARVSIRRGFDRATLTEVLDVLAEQGGR